MNKQTKRKASIQAIPTIFILPFSTLASNPFTHRRRATNQPNPRLLAMAQKSDYVSVHRRDITLSQLPGKVPCNRANAGSRTLRSHRAMRTTRSPEWCRRSCADCLPIAALWKNSLRIVATAHRFVFSSFLNRAPLQELGSFFELWLPVHLSRTRHRCDASRRCKASPRRGSDYAVGSRFVDKQRRFDQGQNSPRDVCRASRGRQCCQDRRDRRTKQHGSSARREQRFHLHARKS
jgi:hypothetical protein